MIATLKCPAAAMLVTAAMLCASARGQASQPTSRPATQAAGDREGLSRRLVGSSDGDPIPADPQSPWAQWGRTMMALAVVVVLIFVARVMLKRFGPVSGPHRRQALDVLARATVSSRHQLLLVRMGRRVVLVGQGPSALATLSEVTDPEEVAALIEAAGGKPGSEGDS